VRVSLKLPLSESVSSLSFHPSSFPFLSDFRYLITIQNQLFLLLSSLPLSPLLLLPPSPWLLTQTNQVLPLSISIYNYLYFSTVLNFPFFDYPFACIRKRSWRAGRKGPPIADPSNGLPEPAFWNIAVAIAVVHDGAGAGAVELGEAHRPGGEEVREAGDGAAQRHGAAPGGAEGRRRRGEADPSRRRFSGHGNSRRRRRSRHRDCGGARLSRQRRERARWDPFVHCRWKGSSPCGEGASQPFHRSDRFQEEPIGIWSLAYCS